MRGLKVLRFLRGDKPAGRRLDTLQTRDQGAHQGLDPAKRFEPRGKLITAFGGNNDLIAPAVEDATEHFLAAANPVHVSRIEIIDSTIVSQAERTFRLQHARARSDRSASETELRDFQISRAETPVLHG